MNTLHQWQLPHITIKDRIRQSSDLILESKKVLSRLMRSIRELKQFNKDSQEYLTHFARKNG